ncbi:MAG: diguanylate cyclase [Elusimicrobia bacterium]|nr:diguanylate cyclase [Elusimicrobiota bacterium]
MKARHETLYRIHTRLNRVFQTEDALLEAGVRLIGRALHADRIGVFLCADGDLQLRYALHRELWLEMDEVVHLADASPLARLVEGRRASLSAVSPHAVLYVPLRSVAGEGEALGTLRFERLSSRRPFSAAERMTAGLLAAELAQNLERTRSGSARRRQLKRLEALTDLAAVFASSLRVEDGVKLILQGITRHFCLDRARLYLLDRERSALRGEVSADLRGRSSSLRGEEIPLKGDHRFARIMRGEGPDPIMKRYEERVVYLPLSVQGQNIGLLVVDNLVSQQTIPGEDIGLLRSFAGQIALAVDNQRLFEEVQALSLYDHLTGLAVRRYFAQRFQEELYRVERGGAPLSVVMIDVDHFKGINDGYGHQVGDLALKEFGKLILKRLRKIDFPARYGGDEVVILLPQASAEDAANIMGRLLADLRELRIPVPFSSAKELSVTASIGIASYPEDGRTAEDLLQRADEALYWVKTRGRDGVCTYRQALLERPSAADR